MFVVNNYRLHRLKRNVDDVFDLLKALVGCLLASSLLEIKPQILDGPFRAVLRVILVSLLLNRHISQMDFHVLEVVEIVGVLLVAEARKTE